MVAYYSSALDGVAANPALPTPLLLRLISFEGGDDRRPFESLHRAMIRPGLPESAIAAVRAHPIAHVRSAFATSGQAEPEQRALLVDDPSPKVRAAVAIGPEWTLDHRTKVRPLPDAACERLLADPELSVRKSVLHSDNVAPSFLASLAGHPDPAARRAALRVWDELTADEHAALLADPDPEVRRRAEVCACPQDAKLTTALFADPASLREALRRGRLDRAEAEQLLTKGVHLADLAANPSLPPDLVDRLAVDPDHDVRLAVSLRPELTEARRAAIDVTVEAWARVDVDWVGAGTADQDVLRRAVTSAHPLLRRAAARSPHLSPDLLRLLAEDTDFEVHRLLAVCHPDTPVEVLMGVYAKLGGTFSAWMATGHPNFPREGLAHYADHPDPIYRHLVVRDPAATPDLIERLSHDPDTWTRQSAARDPRLPLPRLIEALTEPELAYCAGANPALPPDEMAGVMDRAGVPSGKGEGEGLGTTGAPAQSP
ncbi:Mucin-2 [Streptomyces sp. NPDC002680]|uniref:Mucin-2 n=1 Tax=Streptomyces sp. NPDC002680 TaxID=3364659 RepID=UPI0036A15A24